MGAPTWSCTKRELFYGRNGQIMVAAFAVNGDVRCRSHGSGPRGAIRYAGPNRMFDLHPDGERFAHSPSNIVGAKRQGCVHFHSLMSQPHLTRTETMSETSS